MTSQTANSWSKLTNLSNWRKALILLGIGLIAFALISDTVGLSAADGLGQSQLLIILVGMLLGTIGILGPHIPAVYRATALILFNTLIFVLVIEFGLRGVDAVRGWFDSQQVEPEPVAVVDTVLQHDSRWDFYYDYVANLPYYVDQPWTGQFISDWVTWEIGGSSMQFYPYTLWRSAPFTSETINFGEDRLRVTPGAECVAGAHTVYMFGGSTLVGYGSPDEGTIPAYFQAQLAGQSDVPVCVKDFGQLGYASTQGLIELMGELQRGRVPDTVIFYDGVNEVRAANRAGEAYSPVPWYDFDIVFEGIPEAPPQVAPIIANSKIYQLFGGLLNRVEAPVQDLSNSRAEMGENYFTMGVDRETLARDVVENYLGVYQLVDALAQTQGFDFYMFWQPVMYVDYEPRSEEEAFLWSVGDFNEFPELFVSIYDVMADEAPDHEHLYDISGIFSDYEDTPYIDYMHVNPAANEAIARQVFEIMQTS